MDWRRLANKSHLRSRASVCVDCTPEYKAQMLTEDRCAEPEVYFHLTKDLLNTRNVEMVGDFPEDRLRAMKNGSQPWGEGRMILRLKRSL